MKRLTAFVAAALTVAATLFSGCHSVDDDRIPPLPVYLAFTTVGMWDTYGVAGATFHRRFILTERLRVPENFPFTALSQTGYGGILLVSDILGDPQAYDLACPVEVRQDVRIRVDSEKMSPNVPSVARHTTYSRTTARH